MTPSESLLATGRGKLILALLCSVAFIDFMDASIVNIALPSIRDSLNVSVQDLQWVPSGYLLTYGGFMLLGGRMADLIGRRRVLISGTVVIALASLVGGFAQSSGVLIGARLLQGVGAAMMLPAALSILTTSFKEGRDRNTALGAWGGVAGLASAAGVLLGGVLTEGPGWRWVLFVYPPLCALVLGGIYTLVPRDEARPRIANFDLRGAVLATGGMLLLVFTLVKAPDLGWGATRTIAGLAGSLAVLAAFVLNEARNGNPLLPLSIFRVRGLAAADGTQLIAVAGFLAMFFFLTFYMQNVLDYSPIQTGVAYLPVCFTVAVVAGVTSQLIGRLGTRALTVSGALIAAGGVYWLSKIPVGGSYASDLLPGLVIMSVGLGMVFVSNTTAANAGVPPDRAGLAAALINASQQVGGALGLAIFTAIATSRTNHLLAAHAPAPEALTSGFQRALLVSAIFLVAAALIGLRTSNTRETEPAAAEARPEPVMS